ncbi:hypothetical protein EG834_13645 [bacterium]|nr:hypothetical protein [bacterium]
MAVKNPLTKILAIAGTILTAGPLLLPLFFGLMNALSGGQFLVDFLMPAELFLAVLAGGAMLVWAAVRTHLHTTWMTWSLSVAVCSLALSTGAAVINGQATGEIDPQQASWIVSLVGLGLYLLAVLALAVGGGRLIGDVFRRGEG